MPEGNNSGSITNTLGNNMEMWELWRGGPTWLCDWENYDGSQGDWTGGFSRKLGIFKPIINMPIYFAIFHVGPPLFFTLFCTQQIPSTSPQCLPVRYLKFHLCSLPASAETRAGSHVTTKGPPDVFVVWPWLLSSSIVTQRWNYWMHVQL